VLAPILDLKQDPGEMLNLAHSQRTSVQAARLALARAMDETVEELGHEGVSTSAPPPLVTVDEETREQLQALGYQQ
jgi:hypothetical protein